MLCLLPLPCHFPLAITSTYPLTSPSQNTLSLSYFEVDHLLVLPVGLQMSTALLSLLLSLLPSVNLSIPLFLPLSLPASLFITPSAVSPHSHSPVSFGPITASHLPSFRLDFLHVSLIFLSFLPSPSSLSLSLSLLSSLLPS